MSNSNSNMFYGADTITFQNAKRLRDNMTATEIKLWNKISDNKLGVRFKAQHPISKYIVDFYCHSAKLIIEIDGPTHFSDEVLKQDEIRTEELRKFDLRLVRFTNEQVFKDMNSVLEAIQTMLYG